MGSLALAEIEKTAVSRAAKASLIALQVLK